MFPLYPQSLRALAFHAKYSEVATTHQTLRRTSRFVADCVAATRYRRRFADHGGLNWPDEQVFTTLPESILPQAREFPDDEADGD